MDKESKDLINQLKALNENIDLLTKVTAISVGKETIFKGMKELGDKVDTLDVFDLPDKTIAIACRKHARFRENFKKQNEESSDKTDSN